MLARTCLRVPSEWYPTAFHEAAKLATPGLLGRRWARAQFRAAWTAAPTMSHDASTTVSYMQRVNEKVNLATEARPPSLCPIGANMQTNDATGER